MKQFFVIDQLCINEYGVLMCRKPFGRSYHKAHFKQGDLDSASGAYSLAMVFNILGIFGYGDLSRNAVEHDKKEDEWKLIQLLNNPDLYPNGLNPCDLIKMVEQDFSKYVTIDHTGKKASIPLKVKESIDNNIPVILQISFDQYETQWVVAVGYAINEEGQMVYLLTLDSRKYTSKYSFWNGMLDLDKRTTHKYGFQYLTDAEEWASLDDAVIIKKK